MRERDSELRGPTLGIDARARQPHWIKIRLALVIVAREVLVEPDPRGSHAEGGCGAPIKICVEKHAKVFRLVAFVPPAHRRLDRRARKHAGTHVQRRLVIGEADFHAVAWRRAFVRLLLQEVGQRRRVLPGGVVQTPVDSDYASGQAHGVGPLPPVLIRLREGQCRVEEQDEKRRNQEPEWTGQRS